MKWIYNIYIYFILYVISYYILFDRHLTGILPLMIMIAGTIVQRQCSYIRWSSREVDEASANYSSQSSGHVAPWPQPKDKPQNQDGFGSGSLWEFVPMTWSIQVWWSNALTRSRTLERLSWWPQLNEKANLLESFATLIGVWLEMINALKNT